MKKVVFLGGRLGKKRVRDCFANSSDFEVSYITVPAWKSAEEARVGVEAIIEEVAYVDGVVALTDRGSLVLGLLVSRGIVKNGPDLRSVLFTQHKLQSRRIQKKVSSSIVPEFDLLSAFDARSSFFVKPVYAFLSSFASSFDDYSAAKIFSQKHEVALRQRNVSIPFFLSQLEDEVPIFDSETFDFIAETLLPDVPQITVDGFVDDGGITVLGFSRSDFFEGTNSFESFHFPHSFGEKIDTKVVSLINKLISAHELRETFFNVELRIDVETGEIWVVELNTRMSFQFSRMISEATGFNVLVAAARLACGERLDFDYVADDFHKGSLFIMRRENDALVKALRTHEELALLHKKNPSVYSYYTIDEGKKLSNVPQDTEMFRYGCVLVLGESFESNRKTYEELAPQLEPDFEEL